MANSFTRSWEITKLSFKVMRQDKELLVFPILSGIFSLIFIIALLFPTIIIALLRGFKPVLGVLELFLLFIIYFGLAFIATFFNVCVVYTTKKRLEGGNATFGESINFSISKIHLIIAWSLISATVGIILRLIDNLAEKMGQAGRILLKIINAALGMMWSIITIFVVPAMVYHDLGPIDAIKKSVEVFRKTWGESLIRFFGLGLVEFVLLALGALLTLALALVGASLGLFFILTVFFLAVLYFLAVVIVFSVANSVFNTTLYYYASTGKVPHGIDREIMKNAFVSR